MGSPSNKKEDFLKYGSGSDANQNDRARLHFQVIKDQLPELASRVEIIRSRVIQLQKTLDRDAKWALNWFNRLTIITIVIPLILLGIIIFSGLNDSISFSLIILSALTVIIAGMQAFGWNNRYAALFKAKWEIASLRLSIDNEILSLALKNSDVLELSDDDRKHIAQLTENCIQTINSIFTNFGDSYGKSLGSTKIPSFNLGRKEANS